MIKIRYFAYAILAFVGLFILTGFVLPFLMSAKDDFFPVLGAMIIVALIFIAGVFGIKLWNRVVVFEKAKQERGKIDD